MLTCFSHFFTRINTYIRMRGLEQEGTFRTELLNSYYEARVAGLVELLETQRVRYLNATEALTGMKAMRAGLDERVQTVEAVAKQCRDDTHLLIKNMQGMSIRMY